MKRRSRYNQKTRLDFQAIPLNTRRTEIPDVDMDMGQMEPADDALYGMHMGITHDRYRSAPSQYSSDMSGAEVMGESWFLGEQFSGGVSPNMFYDIMRGLVDSEDNSVDPETGIRSKGLGFYGGLPVDMDDDGEIDHILTKDGLKPTGQPTHMYGLRRNVNDDGIPDPRNPIEY